MDSKPKRRLFRFSLRTLLVFVTVAAAGFGWLGVKVRQAQQQATVVAELTKMRGWFWYDYKNPDRNAEPPGPAWLRKILGDDFFANVVIVSMPEVPLADDWLKNIRGFNRLEALDLTNTQITDAGLAHLSGLTQLERLSIDGTRVTDSGLAHLQGCTKLKRLVVNCELLTDTGVNHLQMLPQLNRLILAGSRIPEECLARLQNLPRLIELDLKQVPIKDADLVHLRELSNLTELHLVRTGITDAAVKELQEALPNLEIVLSMPIHASPSAPPAPTIPQF